MRIALRLTVALLLFLATGEIALRVAPMTPRVQIIRADTPGLTTVGGAPVWRIPGPYTEALEARGCVAATDVVVVGDSTFYVAAPGHLSSGEGGEEPVNVTQLLQAEWRARGLDRCVHNLAQPGFRPDQQLLTAAQYERGRAPALLVIGVWKPATSLTSARGAWYDLHPYQRDSAGLPQPFAITLPAAPSRWLFGHSRLWEALALVTGPLNATIPADYTPLLTAAVEARARGISPLLVEFVKLDRPLADANAARILPLVRLELAAREAGIPYVTLARELAADDVTAIRLDTCCHFNPTGHRRLAEVLGPAIDAALRDREAR